MGYWVEILPYEGGEVLVAQRICGCSIPGNIKGQASPRRQNEEFRTYCSVSLFFFSGFFFLFLSILVPHPAIPERFGVLHKAPHRPGNIKGQTNGRISSIPKAKYFSY